MSKNKLVGQALHLPSLHTVNEMSTVYQSSELGILGYNRIHAIMSSDRMSPTLPWITLYPPSPPTHPSSWEHLLPAWCHLHSPAPISFPLRGYLVMLLIWLWGSSPALLSTSLCHGHLYLVGTASAYQSHSCVCLSSVSLKHTSVCINEMSIYKQHPLIN